MERAGGTNGFLSTRRPWRRPLWLCRDPVLELGCLRLCEQIGVVWQLLDLPSWGNMNSSPELIKQGVCMHIHTHASVLVDINNINTES